jgi:4-hydroxy-tetrahydrodipicolinate reductase
MSTTVRIGIAGITGRMGRETAAIASGDPRVTLVGGIVRRQPDPIGWPDWLITTVPEQLLPEIDCLIDLTLPEATGTLAHAAAAHRVPLLCGVTGLGSPEIAALETAAAVVPVHWSRNLSQGIPLIARLMRELAAALGEWDVEITETHHRGKREAPSGTALLLAEAVAEGRGQRLERLLVNGRQGESPRQGREIGMHALRAGSIPGEHTLLFASEDEVIQITHRALGRSAFARGAIEAALGLIGQPTGLIRT